MKERLTHSRNNAIAETLGNGVGALLVLAIIVKVSLLCIMLVAIFIAISVAMVICIGIAEGKKMSDERFNDKG